jgi:hypothetical protein
MEVNIKYKNNLSLAFINKVNLLENILRSIWGKCMCVFVCVCRGVCVLKNKSLKDEA